MGQVGWQLGSDPSQLVTLEPAPSSAAPKKRGTKPLPRKPLQPSEPVQQSIASPAPASSPRKATPSVAGDRLGTASVMGDKSARKTAGPKPKYLHAVMTELHSSDRVPLWKEEMVDRVKRRSRARHETEDKLASTLPASARSRPILPSMGSSGHHHGAATARARSMGGTPPKLERMPSQESEVPGLSHFSSQQVKEIDRKLYWYQDAIHEHELQCQLLDAKSKEVQDEIRKLVGARSVGRNGALNREADLNKRMQKDRQRLSRTLQVSEERVADSLKLNKMLMQTIDQLRSGRADFLHQMGKLNERDDAMGRDMKHFAQVAHSSLDEKEKVEARLKRQQFDAKIEAQHLRSMLQDLEERMDQLDEAAEDAYEQQEINLQKARRAEYSSLKQKRDEEQQREHRLGYLQNQVRWAQKRSVCLKGNCSLNRVPFPSWHLARWLSA